MRAPFSRVGRMRPAVRADALSRGSRRGRARLRRSCERGLPFLRVGGCAFARLETYGGQANCRKPYKRMRFREARDLGGARFRCSCESAHAGYACESMLTRLSRASVSFGAGCCSSPSGRPAVRPLQPPRQVRFAANCTGASFLCRGSYKIADFPSSFLPPYL